MENLQRPMLLLLGICIFSMQWKVSYLQVNVALRGITTQSSTVDSYYSNLAIDGNRESDAYLGSCSHTNTEDYPWWRVDLLAVYNITNITITNRFDCCSDRINGAEIHISNSLINNGNNNPRCVVIASMGAGASVSYDCNMQGRYVNVIIPNISQILTLCEVEVYVPVTRMTFLTIKLKSNEDLSNPTINDKVLEKIKSTIAPLSEYQVSWTKEPELETET